MPNYSDYLELINGLRENELLCNATLTSRDGVTFKVHSAILIASSEFFRAAFEFGPGEGSQGVTNPNIRLPYINGDVLGIILRYIYLRLIDLDCSNAWKILLAADFLQMLELSDLCRTFMKKNLSLPQCTKIFEMTQSRIYLPEIHQMAVKYTLENLCKPSFKLRKQQKMAIGLLQPEIMCSLLQNDILNAPREQFVWEALIEWLENSPHQQHSQFFEQLLDTIRIGLLPKNYVADNILSYPAISNRPDLAKHVRELDLAVDQLLTSGNFENAEIPKAMQPRLPHTVVLSVGGWVNGAPSLEIQFYDLNANAWAQVAALESSSPDHSMAYHGLACLGDDLYVIGGTENGTDTTRCLRLSLKTFKWEVLPSLTQSRDFVSVVALDNKVYAIGGRSNPHHARNSSAECYDPLTNKWNPIANMNHSRSDAGCTIYAGKIYAIGGFTGESVLASAEVYDPSLDSWQLLPEMTTPRSGVRCVTLRKHIYAVGGFSGSVRLSSVERLDPERGIWIPMEQMLTPRSNLGVAVVGDEILAIGGYNGRSVDASVEVYNIFEDKWHQLADLPTPRSALDVVTIEDAADLSVRLLGVHRGQAKLVSLDRNRHQPEFGCKAPPNAELPAGQPQVAIEDDEDDEDWDNVIDPFGLALIMPVGIDTTNDDGGGVWATFRLFGDDDAGTIENEQMDEWTDEDEVDWEDDDSDYLDAEDGN